MSDRQQAWRKAIADQVRRNCTPSSEEYAKGGDTLIAAVADWIENPPEWSHFDEPDGEAGTITAKLVLDATEFRCGTRPRKEALTGLANTPVAVRLIDASTFEDPDKAIPTAHDGCGFRYLRA